MAHPQGVPVFLLKKLHWSGGEHKFICSADNDMMILLQRTVGKIKYIGFTEKRRLLDGKFVLKYSLRK